MRLRTGSVREEPEIKQRVEAQVDRRTVLKVGLAGLLGLSQGRELAAVPPLGIPRSFPPSPSFSSPIRSISGPLFGIRRTLINVPAANFPNHRIPSTSYPVFASPFWFWRSLSIGLPYYGLNNRSSFQPTYCPNNQRSSDNQSNSCFTCQPGSEIPGSGDMMETTIKYLQPETEAEIKALKALRDDSFNSLVRNGYYRTIKNGEERNTPEQLHYYLTTVILAHTIFDSAVLGNIAVGLKKGNPALVATYGNVEFFQDARSVIDFHKARQAELSGVTADVLAKDTKTIIQELKKTQAKVIEQDKDQGIERVEGREFTIDHPKEKAALIAGVYHRLDVGQLEVICDALTKASSKEETDWEKITFEQNLYIEQLLMNDIPQRIAKPTIPEIIDPATFLLYIMTLNDSHSHDGEGKEKRVAINDFIIKENDLIQMRRN